LKYARCHPLEAYYIFLPSIKKIAAHLQPFLVTRFLVITTVENHHQWSTACKTDSFSTKAFGGVIDFYMKVLHPKIILSSPDK